MNAKTSCDICRNSGNCDDYDRKECGGLKEKWISEVEAERKLEMMRIAWKTEVESKEQEIQKLGEVIQQLLQILTDDKVWHWADHDTRKRLRKVLSEGSSTEGK